MPDLQARREVHCLTQGELAALMGIRREQTIADRERGVVKPRLRQRARCAALDITSAVLWDAVDAADAAAPQGRLHG